MSSEQPVCMGCYISGQFNLANPASDLYFKQPIINTKSEKLTIEEVAVLQSLVDAWNGFNKLTGSSEDNKNEFRQAIHICQTQIALRVARRVDPWIWSMPE